MAAPEPGGARRPGLDGKVASSGGRARAVPHGTGCPALPAQPPNHESVASTSRVWPMSALRTLKLKPLLKSRCVRSSAQIRARGAGHAVSADAAARLVNLAPLTAGVWESSSSSNSSRPAAPLPGPRTHTAPSSAAPANLRASAAVVRGGVKDAARMGGGGESV